jgi:hypothetical protein
MISQLDTVRSATEVDARVEEKLVLLGPVLERFENEALDPALQRIFSIMLRKGLLRPPPAEVAEAAIEVQYVSVLSDAQRAVGAAPIERYMAFIGSLVAIFPGIRNVPNIVEIALEYANRLGVPARGNNTRDEIAEATANEEQQQALAQSAQIAPDLAGAAKTLSETQVGGGADALSRVLGG